MFFGRTLPLQSLIELCRALRHNLGAGISLRKVFAQQSERGPASARPVAARIADRLEKGDSLEDALKAERVYFPSLFLQLASVGEETGHLPEIFGELEKYYMLQQKLRREFRSKSMLPVIQLIAAFFVVGILISVLGMIASFRGGNPPGILGYTGIAGGVLFLVLSFATVALIGFTYFLLTRSEELKRKLDSFWLRTPALGPAMEALALGRFALALQLTMETGMPIARALRLSLAATGNAAYEASADAVAKAVKNGEPVFEALTEARVFPQDFLHMVATGEEGGRIPEMMRHQADYYAEEASRRLTTLTKALGMLVWLVYAGFMIVAIFSIANIYLSALGG